MALDDLVDNKSDEIDKDVDASDNEEETKEVKSTKEFIAVNMRDRVLNNNHLDIQEQDGRLEGSTEDFAMLFALMTMDIKEADFDELINDP